MAVDFAVAIDLEGFIEEALVGGLVVVEGVGVLGPGAHFELDAEWGCTYNGGFMISFFMGFMNLFAFMSYYIINHRNAGRLTHRAPMREKGGSSCGRCCCDGVEWK